MATKQEKLIEIKSLLKKRELDLSNKQVEALTKKIDELVIAIKAKPETHIVTQIPSTIHVDNLKEIEKAPEIVTVKNTDRQITGSVDIKNFPKKIEVEMKKPGWVKDVQQVEVTNKPEKPFWIDGAIADIMGLFAALFARVAAGTVEGISKTLSSLWAAGMTVRFKGPQAVMIIDSQTGKPMNKYDFGGGNGGAMMGVDTNPVKDMLEQYKISDMDDAADPKYYGFINKDGDWYIVQENTASKTYRYCKGSGNYDTATTGAWATRASLVYDYFNKVF
jgi:hypothetical protein